MSSEVSALLLIIGFLAILASLQFVSFLREFGKDLRFVNTEIKRSSPTERPRWIRARRRLFLSLIPFYKPKRRKKHR